MSDLSTEKLILSSLCLDEQYSRNILVHLKDEYFNGSYLKLYKLIEKHTKKYDTLPNKTFLLHDISEIKNPDEKNHLKELVNDLFSLERPDSRTWLIEQTEIFCQEKAIYNAVAESLDILEGKNSNLKKEIVPELLSEAIAVTFDNSVGMDYYDDAEKRYDLYTTQEDKIPFEYSILNKITDGGVSTKTLNIIVAAIHAGKTLTMVDLACGYLKQGYNVLYISLEMAEDQIIKRVDSNLFGVDMSDLKSLTKDVFLSKVQRLKSKNYGRLKVKQYPIDEGHCGHFKTLLQELKLKQKFTPEIIIVDYLGICASSRVKKSNTNSYEFYKCVATELRALAQNNNIVLWSAVQIQRDKQTSSDAGMENVSESIAIAAAADSMFYITRTEELDELGQIKFKQLKNRFGDKTKDTNFIMGVDLGKQSLFEIQTYDKLNNDSDLKNYSEDEINNIKSSYKKENPNVVLNASQNSLKRKFTNLDNK